MSDPGFDHGHPLVRRLAEEAAAADLFRAAVGVDAVLDGDGAAAAVRRRAAAAVPSMRALVAYARRDRGAPADFAIEQAVRTDAAVARRYRNLIAGIASAFSPAALAAASEPVPGRVIGRWRLRVSHPAGLAPVLVLEQVVAPAPAPTAIEAVGPAGGPIRLELPAPVRGSIQLPLDGDFAELAAFHRLIADPETAIALFD